MIDVQKCPLGTFKKDLFSSLYRLMNRQNRVRNQGPDLLPNLQILCNSGSNLTGFRPISRNKEFTSLTRALSLFVNMSGCKRSPTRIPTLAILSP